MSLVSGLECGRQKADEAGRHGIRPIDEQQHLLILCSWGLVTVESDDPNKREREGESQREGQTERRRQGRRQDGVGDREQWSCCWGTPPPATCQASVFVSCDPPLCSSGQVTLCLASWSRLLCFPNKRPRPRPIPGLPASRDGGAGWGRPPRDHTEVGKLQEPPGLAAAF